MNAEPCQRPPRLAIQLGLLISCCLLHSALAATERPRVGRAYDAASGVLLYEERHIETLVGNDVVNDRVQYVDDKGNVFGSKDVDFRKSRYAPNFRLSNNRSGHQEQLNRIDDDTIEVSYRENTSQESRTARIAAANTTVADAGFDRYIELHWDELLAGEQLTLPFLVPSRLEFMDFRIRRTIDESSAGSSTATDSNDEVRFIFEVDSALLRLIAPSMTVRYDRNTRRLLRYDGLSNLRDENGNNYNVRIEFDYGAKARR